MERRATAAVTILLLAALLLRCGAQGTPEAAAGTGAGSAAGAARSTAAAAADSSAALYGAHGKPAPGKPQASSLDGLVYTHKALLPMNGQDVALFVLAFLILSLAAGAGIGGGVLLVPLLSLVGGFRFLETVALSNVTILAGAITNMAFNLPRRNPTKPGPIIDYDLLLLFGPPIVMGSVAGAQLNYFVPGYVTKALVLAVLVPMTWRMLLKARMLWVAESNKKKLLPDAPPAAHQAAGKDMDASVELGDDKDKNAGGSLPSTTAGSQHALPQRHDPEQPSPFAAAAAAVSHAPDAADGGAQQRSASLPHMQRPRLGGRRGSSRAASGASTPTGVSRVASAGASLRRRVSRAASHLAAELNAAASDGTDLADLLGPELMLLTTPAAASSTLALQHSSRELRRSGTLSSRASGGSMRLTTSGSLASSHAASRQSSGRWLPHSGAPSVKDVDVLTDIDSEHSLDLTGAGDVLSPFAMHHQQQQLVRQETLQRQATRKQQGSSSSGGAGGAAGLGDLLPARDQGKGAALPVAAVSSCSRLTHEGCHHTPDLEGRMAEVLDHHARAQYPKAHLAVLALILLSVVVAAVCAHWLLTCGSWQGGDAEPAAADVHPVGGHALARAVALGLAGEPGHDARHRHCLDAPLNAVLPRGLHHGRAHRGAAGAWRGRRDGPAAAGARRAPRGRCRLLTGSPAHFELRLLDRLLGEWRCAQGLRRRPGRHRADRHCVRPGGDQLHCQEDRAQQPARVHPDLPFRAGGRRGPGRPGHRHRVGCAAACAAVSHSPRPALLAGVCIKGAVILGAAPCRPPLVAPSWELCPVLMHSISVHACEPMSLAHH